MKKKLWAAMIAAAVAVTSTFQVAYMDKALVLAAPAASSSEEADTSTDGRTTAAGFVFRINGSEAIITGYTGTEKDIKIPTQITVTTGGAVSTPGGGSGGNSGGGGNSSSGNSGGTGSGNNGATADNGVTYNVTSINSGAFSGNVGLQSVTMSGGMDDAGKTFGVRSIGERAFFACQSLTKIELPASLTSLGEFAFADCVALSGITIGDGNSKYKVVDGSLYSYTTNSGTGEYTLEQYVIGNNAKEYKVPDALATTLTEIGEGAFWGSQYLESVALPVTVRSVGANAFTECRKLTSVDLPVNLKSLGTEAFKGDTALTEITIPDNVATIQNATFQGCEALKKVNLSDKLAIIGNRAFQGCKALAEFAVPVNVTTIGDQAFAQCENLEHISIPMKTTSLGSNVFAGTTVTVLCHNGSRASTYAKNNGLSTERTYTVGFYSNSSYSTILSSQEVVEGKDAVPPTVEDRDGYQMRWSGSYTAIRQDTRVYPLWDKLFDVTFVDTFNSEKEVIKVVNGDYVSPPLWSMAGYSLSWDTDLDTKVTNNFTVHAVWRSNATGKKIKEGTIKPHKKGTAITIDNNRYKVYSADVEKPTVKFIGLDKQEVQEVKIPETVTYGGVAYKVVMISANAVNGNENITSLTISKNITAINAKSFYKCKKLKKIKLKSKLITTINNKAFKDIHKKAVFYTYHSKMSTYKKMLKNAGVKNPTIKKY